MVDKFGSWILFQHFNNCILWYLNNIYSNKKVAGKKFQKNFELIMFWVAGMGIEKTEKSGSRIPEMKPEKLAGAVIIS